MNEYLKIFWTLTNKNCLAKSDIKNYFDSPNTTRKKPCFVNVSKEIILDFLSKILLSK